MEARHGSERIARHLGIPPPHYYRCRWRVQLAIEGIERRFCHVSELEVALLRRLHGLRNLECFLESHLQACLNQPRPERRAVAELLHRLRSDGQVGRSGAVAHASHRSERADEGWRDARLEHRLSELLVEGEGADRYQAPPQQLNRALRAAKTGQVELQRNHHLAREGVFAEQLADAAFPAVDIAYGRVRVVDVERLCIDVGQQHQRERALLLGAVVTHMLKRTERCRSLDGQPKRLGLGKRKQQAEGGIRHRGLPRV
mmetsp:Transcript_32241/g.78315  ORF Transcript_32241/g.78315 Transcript_32241/m.78315 type:complete len:258 (+) Transcript_32241:1245-2018(+)